MNGSERASCLLVGISIDNPLLIGRDSRMARKLLVEYGAAIYQVMNRKRHAECLLDRATTAAAS